MPADAGAPAVEQATIAGIDVTRATISIADEAGKSLTIPVKSLTSGFRGVSHLAYWTEPGEYELVATLKSGLMPIPKGAMDNGDGYGIVTLTAAPLKLTVEEKK